MTKKLPTSSECCEAPSLPVSFPDNLAEHARLFRALSEEVRLKVLYLVRDEEVCVCDLVSILGVPQGTLSHHLSVLQQAGLVTARKQGRWNYYKATVRALEPLRVFGLPAAPVLT